MLSRFSLYGFIKNQKYYEPYIILFFLSIELNYAQIGLLIAVREIVKNIFEIPSGSFADLYGRKKTIIISFSSYILSFLFYCLSDSFYLMLIPSFFFGIGDAFRTGTHKAMIFHWLEVNNKMDMRVKVYGYTHSWSKFGSAFSLIISTCVVFFLESYSYLFIFSIFLYFVGIINIASYPGYLDGEIAKSTSLKVFLNHFFDTLKTVVKIKKLRKIVNETICYEGMFEAVKDYIQPVIQSLALTLPIFLYVKNESRVSILIGIIYFILYILSAIASRYSHKFEAKFADTNKSIQYIWLITFLTYCFLTPLLYFEYYFLSVIAFIALFILQNFWRPIHIGRFDEFTTLKNGASILSVESQAKSISTILLAPVIGFLIDSAQSIGISGSFFIPAAIGFLVTLSFAAKIFFKNSKT